MQTLNFTASELKTNIQNSFLNGMKYNDDIISLNNTYALALEIINTGISTYLNSSSMRDKCEIQIEFEFTGTSMNFHTSILDKKLKRVLLFVVFFVNRQ